MATEEPSSLVDSKDTIQEEKKTEDASSPVKSPLKSSPLKSHADTVKEKSPVIVEKTNQKDKTAESVENDDDQQEEAKGIYDQPLVVSGSRKRKVVERFVVEKSPEKKTKEIIQGKGLPIKDIPNICFQLEKRKGEDLKLLHRVLYGNTGKAREVKASIRQFSGFVFSNPAEKEKKNEILLRITNDGLKEICTILDISRGGDKSAIISRIIEFLEEPKVCSDVLLSEKAAKKAKKKAKKTTPKPKKNSTKTDSTKKKSPKKQQKPSQKYKSRDAISDDEEEDDDNNSNDDETDDSSDDSSDDEPLVKKPKVVTVTDTDIVNAVKDLLAQSDLEELSKKKVRLAVAEKFPSIDISEKKSLISRTIESFLENN